MANIDLDSGKVYFYSDSDYQKIFMEDTETLTASGSGAGTNLKSVTINHNLGYYPLCRVWHENDNGDISEATNEIASFMTPWFDGVVYFFITTTTLKIYLDRLVTSGPSVTRDVYYRIYYDAA